MSSDQIRDRIMFYKIAVFILSVSILITLCIFVYQYGFSEVLYFVPYLLINSFFITGWIRASRRLKRAENLEMVQEIMRT